jgi:hypothetical protein
MFLRIVSSLQFSYPVSLKREMELISETLWFQRACAKATMYEKQKFIK